MSISKEEYERLGLSDFLKNSITKKLKQSGKELKKSHQTMRDEFLEDVWRNGGKGFVSRVEKYGRTERDTPLQLSEFYREYLECIGDFRINHVLTLAPAQLGKTLGHTLLVCDTATVGRLSPAWFYAQFSSLTTNVGIQFQPVVENYIKALAKDGITFNRERDRVQLQRFQIEGQTIFFSFVSTNNKVSSNSSGLAVVGGAASSFTADGPLIFEERSQWAAGAADPLPRRLDASLIASKPIRELSTPGGGGGIESGFKGLDGDFYPAVECPHCGEIIFIDPKGCLLKAFERIDSQGQSTTAYLSESGRPQEWFHKDPNDPVNTAYFGCSNCHNELTKNILQSARFRCRDKGVWLRDFIDAIPKGIPDKSRKVGLRFSPLSRKSKINLAADIIKSGLSAVDARDFSEQVLGHPSETIATSITMPIIKRSIESPPPQRVPEVRLAGIDQARGQYWLCVADFCPPAGWKDMSTEEVIDKTVRNYVFMADIPVRLVPNKLLELKVNFALIDNEPDRRAAAELQRTTVCQLADQIDGLKDAIRKVEVEEGGTKVSAWQLRNSKFLNQMMTSFFLNSVDDGYPLARLPNDFNRWIATPVENSPLRHLMDLRYDPYLGRFVKVTGVDHLAYAAMFMEAAYYIWLTRSVGEQYIAGSLVTVEKPSTTSSYAPLGYGQPRGGRRGSFIPSRRY
jgi:hypothetical protein